MKTKVLVILFVFGSLASMAQELNCKVTISPPQIASPSEKQIYKTLQTELQNFMNSYRWTGDVFGTRERIKCDFNIIINAHTSSNEYNATIFVQSSRPVYKSSFETVLLNYNDKDFKFRYTEYEPISFNEAQFTTNLSSVCAFYAYVLIGLDYDSFSKLGGTPYYQKAQEIVNNAQNVAFKGWRPNENLRNRFWLVDNLLDNNYENIRLSIYEYHRMGLDFMQEDVQKGRLGITNSIGLIRLSHRQRPGSLLQEIYMRGKSQELVLIFKDALPNEKSNIVPILNEVDGLNANVYSEILN